MEIKTDKKNVISVNVDVEWMFPIFILWLMGMYAAGAWGWLRILF